MAPTLRDLQEAAPAIELQTQVLNATTIAEIDAGFERDRPDALFVGPDLFFFGRRVQFATLMVHHKLPAIFASRDFVEVAGHELRN